MSQSARNSYPGQLLRTILQQVDDSGPQQLVKVTGLYGQTIGEAVRSQHFGLTSNPPADAEGLALLIGGGMDRVHLLGLEHPQKRPTNLPTGATRLYDQDGNHVDIRNGVLTVQHATQVVVQIGNSAVITVTSSGVVINGSLTINGGGVTNDGKNISSTHMHTNVVPGPGVSGPPE